MIRNIIMFIIVAFIIAIIGLGISEGMMILWKFSLLITILLGILLLFAQVSNYLSNKA